MRPWQVVSFARTHSLAILMCTLHVKHLLKESITRPAEVCVLTKPHPAVLALPPPATSTTLRTLRNDGVSRCQHEPSSLIMMLGSSSSCTRSLQRSGGYRQNICTRCILVFPNTDSWQHCSHTPLNTGLCKSLHHCRMAWMMM